MIPPTVMEVGRTPDPAAIVISRIVVDVTPGKWKTMTVGTGQPVVIRTTGGFSIPGPRRFSNPAAAAQETGAVATPRTRAATGGPSGLATRFVAPVKRGAGAAMFPSSIGRVRSPALGAGAQASAQDAVRVVMTDAETILDATMGVLDQTVRVVAGTIGQGVRTDLSATKTNNGVPTVDVRTTVAGATAGRGARAARGTRAVRGTRAGWGRMAVRGTRAGWGRMAVRGTRAGRGRMADRGKRAGRDTTADRLVRQSIGRVHRVPTLARSLQRDRCLAIKVERGRTSVGTM